MPASRISLLHIADRRPLLPCVWGWAARVSLLACALVAAMPAQGRPLGSVPPQDVFGSGRNTAASSGLALAGREVWTMDEIRLGIIDRPAAAAGGDPHCRQPGGVQITLNPSLGLGAASIVVSAWRLFEAEEGRLILAFTPRQIRVALSTVGCQPR